MFNTRRSGTVPILVAATLFAGACASSGSGPIYELRPTSAPLTYVVSSEGSNEIETPGGLQGSTFSSEAMLTFEVGEATGAGRTFTAVFESMTLETGGDFGGSSQDLGEELAGQPFRGVIAPDGDVSFTESPEFQRGSTTTHDLENLVAGIVFPLPPGGDPSAGPWPHRMTMPTGGGMDGEAAYEGTMTLVGDTVWNGIEATVMASEGLATVVASGMPEGAPAEVDVVTEVESRTVYVWDPARGVLLEARAASEGAGDVSTMGFDMPMVVASESVITLQP